MTRIGNAIDSKARAEGMAVLDANLLFRDAGSKLRREYRIEGEHWSLAGYRVLNARAVEPSTELCPTVT
jgi:hypothetical protein